jgi:hypothetical protein
MTQTKLHQANPERFTGTGLGSAGRQLQTSEYPPPQPRGFTMRHLRRRLTQHDFALWHQARTLGGTRAREIAIHRFLSAPSVTCGEMVETLENEISSVPFADNHRSNDAFA